MSCRDNFPKFFTVDDISTYRVPRSNKVFHIVSFLYEMSSESIFLCIYSIIVVNTRITGTNIIKKSTKEINCSKILRVEIFFRKHTQFQEKKSNVALSKKWGSWRGEHSGQCD